MAVSRRRFLAALAALPFVPDALERLPELVQEGPIRLRRIIGRVEITEEVRAKLAASRSAFLGWAEEEFPRMGAELELERARLEGRAGFEWQDEPELEQLVTVIEEYGPGEEKPVELVRYPFGEQLREAFDSDARLLEALPSIEPSDPDAAYLHFPVAL